MFLTIIVFLILGVISFSLKSFDFFNTRSILRIWDLTIVYNYVSWIIILICSVVFVIETFMKNRDFDIVVPIILGYFARIVFVFWETYFSHIFNLIHSGADSEMYFLTAYHVYRGETVIQGFVHWNNYSRFIGGYFFRIFGAQRILMQYLNALKGITAVFLIKRIAEKYNVSKKVLLVLLWTGLFVPNFMFLNVISIQEALITFLSTLSFYLFFMWFKDNHIWVLPISFYLAYLASTLHEGMIGLVGGYAVCMVFYNRKKRRFAISPLTIALMPLGFLALSIAGQPLLDQIGWDGPGSLIAEAERARLVGPEGGAGYTALILTGIDDGLDVFLSTPLRFMYFLLAPMPWYWRGPSDIMSFIMVSAFYLFTYITVVKTLIRKNIPNKDVIIMILIVILFLLLIFAWGTSNSGTAMRHRDKSFILHVIMLSMCFQDQNFIPNKLKYKYFDTKSKK